MSKSFVFMVYKRFGFVRKDYEVSHLFFLLIPIHSFIFFWLVVQAEKEWITEKKKGYFQTRLLFPGLKLFHAEECFSRTSKIAVLPVEVFTGIWEEISFKQWEAHLFGCCRTSPRKSSNTVLRQLGSLSWQKITKHATSSPSSVYLWSTRSFSQSVSQ